MRTTSHPPIRLSGWLSRTLTAAVLACGASTAAADLDVWYHDNNGWYQYGDIADGGTVLTPPGYACGRRFPLASYYRWMGFDGDFYGEISSGNFNKDVVVWIPKAGCPYTNDVVVEYTDGSVSFNAPLGTYYLEIHTNYASHWVDEDGVRPPCNCTGGNDEYAVTPSDWGRLIGGISDVKIAIGGGSSGAAKRLVDIDDGLYQLAEAIERDAAALIGRAGPESKRTVASLADQILDTLESAQESLAACEHHAGRSRSTAAAYQSCDAAEEALERAEGTWNTLLGEATSAATGGRTSR